MVRLLARLYRNLLIYVTKLYVKLLGLMVLYATSGMYGLHLVLTSIVQGRLIRISRGSHIYVNVVAGASRFTNDVALSRKRCSHR